MTGIAIGNNEILKISIGGVAIKKISNGNVLVWEEASSGGLLPNNTLFFCEVTRDSPANAVPYVRFKKDGTTVMNNTTGTAQIQTTPWFTPTTTGIGLSYWIIFSTISQDGGVYGGSALNVRWSIDTEPEVSLSVSTTLETKEGVYSYQIWDAASGGNMLRSGQITLQGTKNA